jgi:hypothetical protein
MSAAMSDVVTTKAVMSNAVRRVFFGIVVLVLSGIAVFSFFFFYTYWRPLTIYCVC